MYSGTSASDKHAQEEEEAEKEEEEFNAVEKRNRAMVDGWKDEADKMLAFVCAIPQFFHISF